MDHMSGINQYISESNRRMRESLQQVAQARQDVINREKRTVELLEENSEQNNKLINLQELEVSFLKNMSEDATKIVRLLEGLEEISRNNGSIVETNLLEIEKQLDKLIKNTSKAQDIRELFMDEVKKQMVEKGVNYGFQYMLIGLKLLLKKEAISE